MKLLWTEANHYDTKLSIVEDEYESDNDYEILPKYSEYGKSLSYTFKIIIQRLVLKPPHNKSVDI